jgi:flavodoxin
MKQIFLVLGMAVVAVVLAFCGTFAESERAAAEEGGSRILVAYFSPTGTTKRVAERVADGVGGTLYEIVPQEPYTAADLNYNNDSSRTTAEMTNPSSRPAIGSAPLTLDNYDVIFIGYPIWWNEAPHIISTFLESYDFSGKKVVPFCTSGGSGIANSVAKLKQIAPNAEWLSGSRFAGGSPNAEIGSWVSGLGFSFSGR